ncbi:hypothetical protein BH20ACT19_BH20ACT19_06090 [soil metagenome]
MTRGGSNRAGGGILIAALVLGLTGPPASAQTAQQVPECGDRPSTLTWQVRKDRKRRSVNLAFTQRGIAGAPLRPVQVRIVRPRATRAFEWRNLNRDHYSYRRRGRERATLTVRYVENRSGYQQLGSPDEGPDLPGLPSLPLVPTVPIPGLPGLPTLPLPILPLLTGPAGGNGGEFRADYCVRTIVASAG